MKKRHKITTSDETKYLVLDCGVTIRGMARQLSRSPCKVLGYQTPLEVFTAHVWKVFGLTREFRKRGVSKRKVFELEDLGTSS
jgi:hypothetical protein